jgi:5-bromo-4-chloroindolyl phosphate hydrolysis protein
MNPFLAFFVRMMIAIPAASMTWLVSFFAFDQSFLPSTALSLGGGFLTYWLSSAYSKYRFLKRHQLSIKEYRYISHNLKEAKQKIFRLHKGLLSIRHIPSFTQRVELSRLTRKIYALTKKEPKRFYQAERFYFSHLDSALELTEKYAFLSAQPKKRSDVDQALIETRQTLVELNRLIEKDLYQVISNDIDELYFELDVAKHSINKESKLPDERLK